MPCKGDTLFQSLGTCALGFFFIPLGLFAEMSTCTLICPQKVGH